MAGANLTGSLSAAKWHQSGVSLTVSPRLIVSVQFVVGGQVVAGVEPRSSARLKLTVTEAGLAVLDAVVSYEVYSPRGQLIATGGGFYVPDLGAYRIEWLPTWIPDEGEYLVQVDVQRGATRRVTRVRVPIRYPDGLVQRPRTLALDVYSEATATVAATLS